MTSDDGRDPVDHHGPGRRRFVTWAWPAAAAASVAALLIGIDLAASGQAGIGPGPNRPSQRTVADVATASPARTIDLAHDVAAITGYTGRGRTLRIGYTMRYPECEVVVVHAAVTETPTSVAIQLQSVPIRSQRLTTCPRGAIPQVVNAQLSRRLSGRSVIDRADGGRSVPESR